ncbi:hypothetical protein BMG00_05190 [Thioclava marina]|uniref:Uncharacterized protein n=1 Tax=Thioclava marina TaxID=1915077 RepID=A0ABX3MPX5_9RHOB|nr:hypothetical protein [Thioclava marina]OOY13193.1 hypothetical protein BMG00_05190 [Thioclava marina]
MGPERITEMTEQVSRLLAVRLGAKGHDLETRVSSRARVLPRKVRKAARLLAEAERKAHAPKVARQLDTRAIEAAYATCRHYLEPLGAGDRLRGALLNLGSSIAFIFLVVGGTLLVAMLWSGMI